MNFLVFPQKSQEMNTETIEELRKFPENLEKTLGKLQRSLYYNDIIGILSFPGEGAAHGHFSYAAHGRLKKKRFRSNKISYKKTTVVGGDLVARCRPFSENHLEHQKNVTKNKGMQQNSVTPCRP